MPDMHEHPSQIIRRERLWMYSRRYPAGQQRERMLTEEWGKDWCGNMGAECFRREPCPMHVARAAVNR
jgi:hypothetical protein